MITVNVLFRVFLMRYQDIFGTCFTIDVDGKQYLVTAQHVVKGISTAARIRIYQDEWKPFDVTLVGKCSDDNNLTEFGNLDKSIDIAVLALESPLFRPILPLEPTTNGVTYGQDAYFLGFPSYLKYNFSINPYGFPLPFIRKAVISYTEPNDNGSGLERFYLDGHNNPGFSGGPVIFQNLNNPHKIEYRVAAVVSGFVRSNEPVYEEFDGKQTTVHNTSWRYNTGIVVADSIDFAVEKIKLNPIGCKVD